MRRRAPQPPWAAARRAARAPVLLVLLLLFAAPAAAVGGAGRKGGRGVGKQRRCVDFLVPALRAGCVLRAVVTGLLQNAVPRPCRIVVMAPPDQCKAVEALLPGRPVVCAREDRIVPGVTVESVQQNLNAKVKGLSRRASAWYFQQFLKIGAAAFLPNITDTYVVWDNEMIMLRRSELVDPGGRTRVLVGGHEGVLKRGTRSYDRSYKCLLGETLTYPPRGNGTWVCHHMVVQRRVMLELLQRLTQRRAVLLREDVDKIQRLLRGGQVAEAEKDEKVRSLKGLKQRRDAAAAAAAAPLAAARFVEKPPRSAAPWPAWAAAVVRCIPMQQPRMGFSEYSTYTSYITSHYPAKVFIDRRDQWRRLPAPPKLRLGCPDVKALTLQRERQPELSFVGWETHGTHSQG